MYALWVLNLNLNFSLWGAQAPGAQVVSPPMAGAACYADDIVFLVPCPSALRTLLNICFSYVSSHCLTLKKVIATRYVVFNNVVLPITE